MTRTPKLAAGAVLFALAVMGAEDCASTDDDKSLNSNEQPSQQAEEEPTPKSAKTDGEYDLSCAYELGGDFDVNDPAAGYRFTAGGTIKNTGDTNIRVRVTYQWKRLGSSAKKVQKVYRVREGQERDVNVSVKASSDDISSHQNADASCKATATIVGTFA